MAADKNSKPPVNAAPQDHGKRAGSAFWQLAVVALIFAMLAPLSVWFFFLRVPGPKLTERLRKAEDAIAKSDNAEAKRQILLLKEANYVEDNYGGTYEFLTGILSFREAEKMEGSGAEAMYRRAVSYLSSAEKKSLPARYLPEKSYALGISLYRLNSIKEAVPELHVAWETFPQEKGRIGLYLSQCEMNPNVEVQVDEFEVGDKKNEVKYRMALARNELVLQNQTLSDDDRMLALMQRVDIYLKLGLKDEVKSTLEDTEMYYQHQLLLNPLFSSDNTELVSLRGKYLFFEGNYQQALDLLLPYLKYKSAYENPILREALFIVGECYEKLGNVDQAIANYKRCTILEEADEMIPASLKIANLLRSEKNQHEQAYELYLSVLKRTLNQASFNNHLISWGEIRIQMRDAWKDWSTKQQFRWAIDLSERLPPLFSQDDAHEMSAQVAKSWAESLQEQYDNAVFDQRDHLYSQVVDRWKQAGMSFSLLAKSRMAMLSYPDALWNAALMFRKGNDYANALENIDAYMETVPRGLLPSALVLRGEILMDLNSLPPHDSLGEAIDVFLKVIDEYPKDTASFRARVNLGKAYLELDQPEKALAVWNNILTQPELTPDANEWRQSQYLMAKAWINHVDQLFYKNRQLKATESAAAKEYYNQAYAQLEMSIKTLNEFSLREKNANLLLEAKDLLATALHKLTQRTIDQLPTAETDNLRNELINEIQKRLKDVVMLRNEIKMNLQPGYAAGMLNSQEQLMLKDSYFKSGHLLFELAQYGNPTENYTSAIAHYRDAINNYPQDPQVLLAYYQMSNSYHRLGDDRQARSYLEQARIILQQIPDQQFNSKQTSFNKDEWQRLLDQSLQLYETQTAVN